MRDEELHLNQIYLYLFIVPFFVMLLTLLRENFRYMSDIFKKIRADKRYFTLHTKRFKQFIFFAVATSLISMLYVYASRFPMVYVTEQHNKALMAELGYAYSFFGLILVFITSIRTYLISKFNISDMGAIKIYLEKMQKIWPLFLLGSIVSSLAGSYLVYLVKPDYLADRSVIFLLMLIFTYMMIAYFSLITLLSKTFNYNRLEITLNVIRLVLVLLSVYIVFGQYPIVGFALINLAMVSIEYIFSRIVLKRVLAKI
jgi:hypothetical protein